MKPDSGACLNTLGVAQYRVGEFQAALETLTRSKELNGKDHDGESPTDVAFLAMTLHQLGETDKAHERLLQLRKIMQQPKWSDDQELMGFVEEAEALIEAVRKPEEASTDSNKEPPRAAPPKQPVPAPAPPSNKN